MWPISLSLVLLSLAILLGTPKAMLQAKPPNRPSRRSPRGDELELTALSIELLGATCAAGSGLVRSLEVVASGLNTAVVPPVLRSAWLQISCMHSLGISGSRAWEAAAELPGLRGVARAVQAAGHSGAALDPALQALAKELHQEVADAAAARAEKAGVLLALPLSLFFLPAFFLLGLAPVLLSQGLEIFAGGLGR